MNIIITAGGTAEPIDNVRKITNSSTGKLGIEICKQLITNENINKINYITSNHCLKPEVNSKIELIIANSTVNVYNELRTLLTEDEIDYVIHSMAISDYTTKQVIDINKMSNFLSKTICLQKSLNENEIEVLIKNFIEDSDYGIDRTNKVSSDNENMLILLNKTPKVINFIKEISPNSKLIGFKLLSNSTKEDLLIAANKVIKNSGADFVIANDLRDIKNGEHIGYLISKENKIEHFETENINGINYPKMKSKEEISKMINFILSK